MVSGRRQADRAVERVVDHAEPAQEEYAGCSERGRPEPDVGERERPEEPRQGQEELAQHLAARYRAQVSPRDGSQPRVSLDLERHASLVSQWFRSR